MSNVIYITYIEDNIEYCKVKIKLGDDEDNILKISAEESDNEEVDELDYEYLNTKRQSEPFNNVTSNKKMKIDDKEVYQAMELVKQYLKSKKDFQSYFFAALNIIIKKKIYYTAVAFNSVLNTIYFQTCISCRRGNRIDRFS